MATPTKPSPNQLTVSGQKPGTVTTTANFNGSPSEGTAKKRVTKAKAVRRWGRSGGIGVSSRWVKSKYFGGVKTNVSLACQASVDVLTNTAYVKRISGGKKKQWICGMEGSWRYKEDKYAVQNNEFRLFIEGVEVTHYVQGTMNWTIESTGGMNTCRFQLNNTQDAFILTPENLCAGVSGKSGWRLNTGGRVNLGPSRSLWRNFAVDETAKYLLYKTKYEEVMKDSKNAKIDPDTGMWLYPLGPYRCIIHKHDPVRLFIRLPNTSSIGKKDKKNKSRYGELWTAAFTGFVKDYSWDDDPVNGTRTVSVTCYDYRGLMNRMRVRVTALPQGTSNTPSKTSGGAYSKVLGKAKNQALKAVKQQQFSAQNQWLIPAIKCGEWWQKYFNSKYKGDLWPKFDLIGKSYVKTALPSGDPKLKTGAVQLVAYKNPYELMQLPIFDIVNRLVKLWETQFIYEVRVKNKCFALNPTSRETYAVQGTQAEMNAKIKCANAATKKLKGFYSSFAVRWVQAFAYAMLYIVDIWQWKRDKYEFYVDGTVDKPIIGFRRITIINSEGKALPKENQARTARRESEAADQVANFQKLVKQYLAMWAAVRDGTATASYMEYVAVAPSVLGTVKGEAPKLKGTVVTKSLPRVISHFADQAKLQKEYDDLERKYKSIVAEDETSNQENRRIEANRKLKDALAKLETAKSITNAYITALQGPENDIKSVLKDATKLPKPLSERMSTSFKEYALMSSEIRRMFDTELKVYNNIPAAGKDKKLKDLVARLNQWANFINDTIKGSEIELKKSITDSLNKMFIFLSKHQRNEPPKDRWPTSVRNPYNDFHVSGSNNLFDRLPRSFPVLSKHMQILIKRVDDETRKIKGITNRGVKAMGNVNETILDWRRNAGKNTPRMETTKRIIDKFADFTTQQAGIFADLVEANKSLAHPLMNKSFEEAVVFLTTAGNSEFLIGAAYDITSYASGILNPWNSLAVFGVIQRPITYQEVSAIGQGTSRNIDSLFSPLNGFVHFLRPAQGTGAASIVQTSAASAAESLVQAPDYETRKSLLDKICQSIDYQFYVSPMGDLMFEVPNYNAFPEDFGKTFKESYTISQDWISSTISEENSDVPTAYKFTALTYEKKLADAKNSEAIRAQGMDVYIWPILARRIGVQQQDVKLTIPGVGDVTLAAGDKFRSYGASVKKQLFLYAIFYMQRQLGRVHTLLVRHPYRPYMLPNRPVWLVPRQRIGLPQSVTHSMNAPDGVCTTESQLIYTREMFRDGTFRFVGGGQRQPIDYAGFVSGMQSYKAKEGVGATKEAGGLEFGYGPRLGSTSRFSRSAILNRLRESSNFSTTMGATFGNYFKYKPVISKQPPSPPPAIGGGVVNLAAGGVRKHPAEDGKKPATSVPNLKVNDSYHSLFYSPWKSSAPRGQNPSYNGWGYLRRFNQRLYKAHSRGSDAWHPGIDIFCALNTKMLAPIYLQYLRATIYCGFGTGPVKPITIDISTSQENLIASQLSGGKAKGFKVGPKSSPVEVFFESKPEIKRAGSSVTLTGGIYSLAWDQWKKLTNNGRSGKNLYIGRHGISGIGLIGKGYVTPPNSKDKESGRLYATLQWYHCATLYGTPGKYYGADIVDNIPAGTVIGLTHSRGGGGPHLHLGMWVRPARGKSRTQEQLDLFAKVRKVQKEMVQTQIVAMARGWKYEPGEIVDPNRLDGNAADYWKNRYKLRKQLKERGGTSITVKEVVDYMKKYSKEYRKRVGYSDKRYIYHGLEVDPSLFFQCRHLLIPKKGSTLERHCLGSGEFPAQTSRTSTSSANYAPPPLVWCGTGMSRKVAGGSAKVTQARAKAQKKVIADPSKKKQVNKKLKNDMTRKRALEAQLKKAGEKSKRNQGRVGAVRELTKKATNAIRNRTAGIASSSTGMVQTVEPRPKSK